MDEDAISKLAVRQRGVVSTQQLQAAGFDTAAIKRRCRDGRLRRLHRGVYLLGHAVAPELATVAAALLACGRGSVISHSSAARLWGLPVPWRPGDAVDITTAGRDPGGRPGLLIHRVDALDRRDVRRVRGIPVTAPARTLLDLAASLPFQDAEVAFLEARGRRLVNDHVLSEVLKTSAGRRGIRSFRRLVELHRESGLTRSAAERLMLELVRSAALPVPLANVRVGDFEVDFLWREQKLIVEVDGYGFHSDQRTFERDRERDATLAARGYVVMRVTCGCYHQPTS